MLTVNQFEELFPNCEDPEGWVDALEDILPEYEINTNKRIASFIAQCGHESGGFRVFSENLNYSAKALDIVFAKYFKRAGRDASEYHRQPEKIANVVYADRMENGDTDSGDGWYFRGRGPIQLTGRHNYAEFDYDMNVSVLNESSRVSDSKEIALLSAIWFWNKNNLNQYADVDNIKGMTRRINGGYHGLEDRIHHWELAIEMLGDLKVVAVDHGEDEDEDLPEDIGLLKFGSRGEGVQLIQNELGLTADGIFGKGTERAVKAWQSENGLVPDGIIGPKSLDEMLDD
jgi:putative chitinase